MDKLFYYYFDNTVIIQVEKCDTNTSMVEDKVLWSNNRQLARSMFLKNISMS